jgi:hypothetical protein
MVVANAVNLKPSTNHRPAEVSGRPATPHSREAKMPCFGSGLAVAAGVMLPVWVLVLVLVL